MCEGCLPRSPGWPDWNRCLERLRRSDELVVTKLDRMGRSVQHLIDFVAELGKRGLELVVLDQGRPGSPSRARAICGPTM